jgi:putative oxidoreductase
MLQGHLFFPGLAETYAWLGDVVYALARAIAGLAMVPHGLRASFGFFAWTGRVAGYRQTAKMLDAGGFRPGGLWAAALAFCHLIAGPFLATGFLTRPAALVCLVMLIFASFDRWRMGGYFANTQGLEFSVVWAALVAIFLAFGAGIYSVDLLLIGRQF